MICHSSLHTSIDPAITARRLEPIFRCRRMPDSSNVDASVTHTSFTYIKGWDIDSNIVRCSRARSTRISSDKLRWNGLKTRYMRTDSPRSSAAAHQSPQHPVSLRALALSILLSYLRQWLFYTDLIVSFIRPRSLLVQMSWVRVCRRQVISTEWIFEKEASIRVSFNFSSHCCAPKDKMRTRKSFLWRIALERQTDPKGTLTIFRKCHK